MTIFSTAELELRLLGDVSFVSIRDGERSRHVQIFADVDDTDEMRARVRRIVDAHLPPPVTIQCVTPARSRVRVVDVRTGHGSIEVELAHRERVVAEPASGAKREQVAAATIAALERLGAPVPFDVAATNTLDHAGASATVVVLSDGDDTRFGIANGTHDTAVVRATLAALNRHLSGTLAS